MEITLSFSRMPHNEVSIKFEAGKFQIKSPNAFFEIFDRIWPIHLFQDRITAGLNG